MSLIAEGVEYKQHQDFLSQIGCDEIQGIILLSLSAVKHLLNFTINILHNDLKFSQQKRPIS
jgi:hypothetical protein